MTCHEIEISIPDYDENRLSPGDRQDVETHLGECANCRKFALQLRDLDAALATRLKVPELSAGFDRQVMAQIQRASGTLTPAQRAERKRELQAEFDAGAAGLLRESFGLGNLLDKLTWPVAAVVAGWLAWQLTALLTAQVTAQSIGGLSPSLLPWLAASAAFLAVNLAEAFPRQRGFFGIQ
jgi:anti-sigma factor RsiW